MRREFDEIKNMLKKRIEQPKEQPQPIAQPQQQEQEFTSPNFVVVSDSEMLNAIYQQTRVIVALLEKAINE
jgi:hypothetical protein